MRHLHFKFKVQSVNLKPGTGLFFEGGEQAKSKDFFLCYDGEVTDPESLSEEVRRERVFNLTSLFADSQKLIGAVFIILLVGLSLVGFGYYLGMKRVGQVDYDQLVRPSPTLLPAFFTPAPTEPVTPTRDETANWQTYRNEGYGFELRFPREWTAKDWAEKTPNFSLLVYVGENKEIGDGAIAILIEKDITSLSQKLSFPFSISPDDLEKVFIGQGNYRASKFSYGGRAHELPGEVAFVEYFIERNNLLYQIHVDETGVSKILADQVLATFRFLE